MPNFVTTDNLSADHKTDSNGDLYAEVILQGAGVPVAAPPVDEKLYGYLDTSTSPNGFYVWDPVLDQWSIVGGGPGEISMKFGWSDTADSIPVSALEALDIFTQDGSVTTLLVLAVSDAGLVGDTTIEAFINGAVVADFSVTLAAGVLTGTVTNPAVAVSDGDTVRWEITSQGSHFTGVCLLSGTAT